MTEMKERIDAPALRRTAGRSQMAGRRARWDAGYNSGDRRHDVEAVPLLASWPDAQHPGRALDVAAGLGRHSVLLARRGWTVDAVDLSFEGLRILKRRADDAGVVINLFVADLSRLSLRPASYDLIVQTFFLVNTLSASSAPCAAPLTRHNPGMIPRTTPPADPGESVSHCAGTSACPSAGVAVTSRLALTHRATYQE
jgi:SAM-dependent methyltransferase